MVVDAAIGDLKVKLGRIQEGISYLLGSKLNLTR